MSSESNIQNYIVYLTKAVGSKVAGTVVNIILYNGIAEISLPSGEAIALDADRKYPIGSIYPVTEPTS